MHGNFAWQMITNYNPSLENLKVCFFSIKNIGKKSKRTGLNLTLCDILGKKPTNSEEKHI